MLSKSTGLKEGGIGGYQNPKTRTKIWNNPKTRTKNWENPRTRKCEIKNPEKYTLQQKTFTCQRLVSSFFDISLHWLHPSTKEQYKRLIMYGLMYCTIDHETWKELWAKIQRMSSDALLHGRIQPWSLGRATWKECGGVGALLPGKFFVATPFRLSENVGNALFASS